MEAYKKKILELLAQREEGKTICPSEVLPLSEKKDKEKMIAVRAAAKILVHENKIEVTQKGEVIDLDEVVGPIRLRLKKSKK